MKIKKELTWVAGHGQKEESEYKSRHDKLRITESRDEECCSREEDKNTQMYVVCECERRSTEECSLCWVKWQDFHTKKYNKGNTVTIMRI